MVPKGSIVKESLLVQVIGGTWNERGTNGSNRRWVSIGSDDAMVHNKQAL